MIYECISKKMLNHYFTNLINQFFKILPIRENDEHTLKSFMSSLQIEMIGCKEVVECINHDSSYLSLISILQYMIDNDCDIPTTKREVFKAISICKKLRLKYADDSEV